MMKYVSLTIMLCVMISGLAFAEQDFELKGLWLASKKQDIVVNIAECDTGICGHIIWVSAYKEQKDPGMCGAKVLWGFEHDKPNKWTGGTIYLPDDDETYDANITLHSPESLTLRGYIGLPFIGKSYAFEKIAAKNYPPCEMLVPKPPRSALSQN